MTYFLLEFTEASVHYFDCYVLTNKDIKVGMVLDCVPIGLLEQLENDEVDSKIICLLKNDDFKFNQEHIQQIKDFILQIFKKFPEVEIRFGDYKDRHFAINYINECSFS